MELGGMLTVMSLVIMVEPFVYKFDGSSIETAKH